MSRIGRMPITVPAGVEVTIGEGNVVTVKGPKGELTKTLHPSMEIKNEGGVLTVTRPNDEKQSRSLHGLTRTLLNNMVVGVTQGFKKDMEINGVGYRIVEKKGNQVIMKLGYSHDTIVEEIPGITVEIAEKSNTKFSICGIDKQLVGQFAAEVRGLRPPEPYKGKGIKYVNEVIRRKEGKTAGKK